MGAADVAATGEAEGGRINRIYGVRNPCELRLLGQVTEFRVVVGRAGSG